VLLAPRHRSHNESNDDKEGKSLINRFCHNIADHEIIAMRNAGSCLIDFRQRSYCLKLIKRLGPIRYRVPGRRTLYCHLCIKRTTFFRFFLLYFLLYMWSISFKKKFETRIVSSFSTTTCCF